MKKMILRTILGLSILGLGLILRTAVFAADLILEGHGTLSNVEVVQKTIYIHKGWNLVQGLASREWITGGIDLEKRNIKAIFVLNPLNKKYVRFYPSPIREEVNELQAIEFLTYWVYSDGEGTLNYETAKPETRFRFAWPAGWNIISIIPEFIGKSLESIKGNCVIEKIYWWSPREQKFLDVRNAFSELTEEGSNVGSGLVLKFSNECKLGVLESNNITPPPQLPN